MCLDYVLLIWSKLEGHIYIHESYCKAKLKLSEINK